MRRVATASIVAASCLLVYLGGSRKGTIVKQQQDDAEGAGRSRYSYSHRNGSPSVSGQAFEFAGSKEMERTRFNMLVKTQELQQVSQHVDWEKLREQYLTALYSDESEEPSSRRQLKKRAPRSSNNKNKKGAPRSSSNRNKKWSVADIEKNLEKQANKAVEVARGIGGQKAVKKGADKGLRSSAVDNAMKFAQNAGKMQKVAKDADKKPEVEQVAVKKPLQPTSNTYGDLHETKDTNTYGELHETKDTNTYGDLHETKDTDTYGDLHETKEISPVEPVDTFAPVAPALAPASAPALALALAPASAPASAPATSVSEDEVGTDGDELPIIVTTKNLDAMEKDVANDANAPVTSVSEDEGRADGDEFPIIVTTENVDAMKKDAANDANAPEDLDAMEEDAANAANRSSRQGDDASFNGKPIPDYTANTGNCPGPGDSFAAVPCAPTNLRALCNKYDDEGIFSACFDACFPSFCCIHDAPPETNTIAPNCNKDVNCAQYGTCYIVWWKLHDTIGPATQLRLEQNDDFFDLDADFVQGDVTTIQFYREMLFHHFDDSNEIVRLGTVQINETLAVFNSDLIFLNETYWNTTI